jgi:hypothetical protein
MTDGAVRVEVGNCPSCGRTLRVKPGGLRPTTRLTCRCGQAVSLAIDEVTLSTYGVARTPVAEDVYQVGGTPLFRLLDGPRLKAKWAEVVAANDERWKDLPRELRQPPPDIVSASTNPYLAESNAHAAMGVLVDRLRAMTGARPWSAELYENVGCAISGFIGAPFLVVLGITEIAGCTAAETFGAFQQVVEGLRSDDPRARSGGEWEICSQAQGNQWRSDRAARLLERWVFLDADEIRTFGAPDKGTGVR